MAKGYSSRLPHIASALVARMDAIAAEAAQRVVDAAKERVPVDTGHLRDAIHKQHTGVGEYAVVAGGGEHEVFYGHIVEHGSTHTTAHPFLVPAAAEIETEIRALGIEGLAGL